MSTITREDGTVFSVANYRTTLTVTKASLMRGEMRFLANQHGARACVIPIDEVEAEAIFSREEGYPLGECVWDHLKRPKNSVYVEALTKEHAGQALLVVVRDNRVFMDAMVEIDMLNDEFASLVAENIPVDIHVYGDIPLAETASDDKFAFPEEMVKSFTYCDASVFEELEPRTEFALVESMEALKRSGVMPVSKAPLVIAVCVALALVGYLIHSLLGEEKVEAVKTVVKVDPYKGYIDTLNKPTVASELAFVEEKMNIVYALSGWSPSKLLYVPQQLMVTIEPKLVPDMRSLALWSRHYKVPFEIGDNETNLKFTSDLPKRAKAETIHQLIETVSDIFEDVSARVFLATIKVHAPESKGSYQRAKMSLELKSAPPAILTTIGNVVYGKSVVLDKLEVKVNPDGSFTGSLDLIVLGK